jgi:hypothetical protein
MTHENRDASGRGEQRTHPHRPPHEVPTPRTRFWRWLQGAEREWLTQSWNAAEEFLACDECVPDLDPSQREKIRWRWLKEAEHYDGLWRRRRRWDYALRVPIVIGAATVPVLAALGTGRIPTALVGLAVAILAGLDGLFQLGDRWRQLRQTATLMTREGWSFLELTGPYFDETSHRSAYRRFLDRLEALNAAQTEGYLRVFEEPRDGQRRAQQDV